MEDDVFTLPQRYRNRRDAENNFDELKNQWGWLGFTAHDHAQRDVDVVRRIGLHLVEFVHTHLDSRQTDQSSYFPPAIGARDRTQDESQQSIHLDSVSRGAIEACRALALLVDVRASPLTPVLTLWAKCQLL